MRLLLAGGGTLGSVMPIIALAQQLKETSTAVDILWIGTADGPERKLLQNLGIKYQTIPAGKLRRYFSFKNLIDFGRLGGGIGKSIYILLKFKPRLIIGAGSYVQVPVIWAAGLLNLIKRQRIKIIIHQQDVQKGLANALSVKFADLITISLKKSLADFPLTKTIITGNLYRPEIFDGNINRGLKIFKLNPELPTLLVLGGGTGAVALNQLVADSLPELSRFCQIIHITGKNKALKLARPAANYYQTEFLGDELKDAYLVADLVVSRAGFSTLTELSLLAKPVVLIPMPGSHQEQNAAYWAAQNSAIWLNQSDLTAESFAAQIKKRLKNKELLFNLSINISKILPKNSLHKFLKEIARLTDHHIQIKKW